MSKFYIKCGTLEIIYSCNKSPNDAAQAVIWETNENDILDEYFYIDERGYRDYTSADKNTVVLSTERILKESGWSVE
jgi:hypothetical protein